jgi:hypothetical protein
MKTAFWGFVRVAVSLLGGLLVLAVVMGGIVGVAWLVGRMAHGWRVSDDAFMWFVGLGGAVIVLGLLYNAYRAGLELVWPTVARWLGRPPW